MGICSAQTYLASRQTFCKDKSACLSSTKQSEEETFSFARLRQTGRLWNTERLDAVEVIALIQKEERDNLSSFWKLPPNVDGTDIIDKMRLRKVIFMAIEHDRVAQYSVKIRHLVYKVLLNGEFIVDLRLCD